MRKINFWNGLCPECEMKGEKSRMRLNRDDFFECEACNLQIVLSFPGLLATVLKFRGIGSYRTKADFADENERNELLCPQTLEGIPFNRSEFFSDNDEFINYLNDQVAPIKLKL